METKNLISIGKCNRCGKTIINDETDFCLECSQEEGYIGEDVEERKK